MSSIAPKPESNARPAIANSALAEVLDRHTRVGTLWRSEGERIRCVACGHRCLIGPGRRGICKVRFNEAGQLRVPYGYVAGVQSDPIEKKPFFHVYPGSDALTFGMLGCDFHCSYCQNWVTSQALRDPAAAAPIRPVTAEQLVQTARRCGARVVVSSYNEPLITAEWAQAVFAGAKEAGLSAAFVSNGNATSEALDFLQPWIVAFKVDLKCFDDRRYRSLGGTLAHVTGTIRMLHKRGLWVEVVTLIVPGFNDSDAELKDIAQFIASVDPHMPWHVTAFHRDYQMTGGTDAETEHLVRAATIGRDAGLHFVYAGNLPGRVQYWENTYCPGCQAVLIERRGFLVESYRLTPEGRCPDCQKVVPGIWPREGAAGVSTGTGFAAYTRRLPRRVEFL